MVAFPVSDFQTKRRADGPLFDGPVEDLDERIARKSEARQSKANRFPINQLCADLRMTYTHAYPTH